MTRTGRVAALGLMTLAAWACQRSEAEETPLLQTALAERGDLRITAEATGQVEPIRKVEVKSKASGEILALHVDVGDEVEPGALLAEVDPRDVKNRYDQAVADLEVAQARADIAAAQLARSEEIHASGVITDQELEAARLENSNAQASLIKARTNTDLAELQLTDVTIRAPMAGTILQKSVEEGQVIQSASQNVSGGTTLYMMASLDQMQVRTLVDETDMGEIRSGMPANVQVEAFPDRIFQGVVDIIEPQAVVQQNVTMFPVIVTLDNSSGLLKPGMNAEVEILIDEAQDVLLIPNGAVVLPDDALPAAAALGLDPETLDLGALRGGRGGRDGRGGGARDGGGGESRAAGGAVPGAEGGRGDAMAAEAGSASEDGATAAPGADGAAGEGSAEDSPRAALLERGAGPAGGEPAGGGARVVREGGGAPGDRVLARRGGGGGGGFAGAPARLTRRAVVFVVDSAGVPAPRLVEIGLSDWDRTQVVSGLEEGEELAIVAAAALQEQQQQMQGARFRGGMLPFGGGRVRVR